MSAVHGFRVEREDYTATLARQLAELNRQIDVLELRLKAASADTRECLAGELVLLRRQSGEAAEKYRELRATGDEGWDQVLAEMERLRGAFVRTFSYFKTQL
ncbi:hypothetical protein [Ideonella margarita]|uniref:Uncharacterized protein n=1 Tax=Ideonella margarita TaxID=2984191 RepID=A0ABU9C7B4_9BURK